MFSHDRFHRCLQILMRSAVYHPHPQTEQKFMSIGIGNFYFMAHIGGFSRNVTDGETLVFDVELINEGGHYNSTAGVYTGKSEVASLPLVSFSIFSIWLGKAIGGFRGEHCLAPHLSANFCHIHVVFEDKICQIIDVHPNLKNPY